MCIVKAGLTPTFSQGVRVKISHNFKKLAASWDQLCTLKLASVGVADCKPNYYQHTL